MKLMLLGAPGSGKGTQSTRLTEYFGIPQISTGDLLRSNIRRNTELGKRVKEIIERGDLVSDDIILSMVQQRLTEPDCKNGYILDGFPRTLVQARSFENIDTLDKVINLLVSDQVIMRRITGRRVCKACGKTTHIDAIGEGRCSCGGEVYARDDDNEQTVLNRLAVYDKQTRPLVEFYRERDLLRDIDSDRDPGEVFTAIIEALQ